MNWLKKRLDWFKNRFPGPVNLFSSAIKKYGSEDGSIIAAAISFYALLSLLPLLLLAVSVIGYIIGSSDKAFYTVVGFFNSFIPASTFVEGTLRGLVAARGTIGWIGILSLLWTGSQYFMTLETTLDDIWNVGEKPGFIKMRIKAIILVLLFGVFLALSIGSSSVTALLQHLNTIGTGSLSAVVSILLWMLGFLISLLFAILMFAVVYKLIPDTEVQWRSVLVGATLAGTAWVIAKELYGLYLAHLADFNELYGSLGGAIILIIWIYYSSMIMAFGAELAYVYEHGAREKPEEAERMEKQ